MDPRSSNLIQEVEEGGGKAWLRQAAQQTSQGLRSPTTDPSEEPTLVVPFELGAKPEIPEVDLPPAQAKVLCIASGKGGTGKTTFTTNLAIALQKEGLRVLIVDGDFGLANDHLLLGLEPKGDIGDVLAGRRDIHDILLDGPEGIQLLPGGVGLSDLSTMEGYELKSLARDIGCLEPDFDMILVDLAAGVSPQIMRFLKPAHEVMLVTNPEVTALLDAYGLIKCLSSWKKGEALEFHLVQNRVKDRGDAIASMKKLRRVVDKHLSGVRLHFDGYVPFDRYLLHSISIQEPAVVSHPRSFVTACFKGIAHKVFHRYRVWAKAQEANPVSISYFAQLERQSHE